MHFSRRNFEEALKNIKEVVELYLGPDEDELVEVKNYQINHSSS